MKKRHILLCVICILLCGFGAQNLQIVQTKRYVSVGRCLWCGATIELENELIEEGLLSETEDGYIYVADWENYRYHFN